MGGTQLQCFFFGRGRQEKEEGSDICHSRMAFDSMGNSPQPCILRRLIFFNSLCMTMSAESVLGCASYSIIDTLHFNRGGLDFGHFNQTSLMNLVRYNK